MVLMWNLTLIMMNEDDDDGDVKNRENRCSRW